MRIVRKTLEEPLKLICANAGVEGSVVLEEVRKHTDDWGFDAETGEYGHMIKLGIIDPVKVTRSALQNAASVAGMVLTTESLVTELPEKDKPAMGGGGGGMGGMGGGPEF